MAKYLDNEGFAHFLGKLKTLLDGKAASSHNHAASAINSGTLDSARIPVATDQAVGGIKVGSGLSISNGVLSATGVSVSPASANNAGTMSAADYSKLAAFSSASDYALKTDITSMYKHKGSVSAVANLPSSGQTAGDVYNVTTTGMNYVWTGTEWDALGEIFTITSMTTTEIDTAFTTAGLVAAA